MVAQPSLIEPDASKSWQGSLTRFRMVRGKKKKKRKSERIYLRNSLNSDSRLQSEQFQQPPYRFWGRQHGTSGR